MPQPFIGSHKVTSRSPADALSQRPRLAAQIGMINSGTAKVRVTPSGGGSLGALGRSGKK